MISFPRHTVETAAVEAKPQPQAVVDRFGFRPNIYAHFAEAPAALTVLLKLGSLFSRTSLTEQQRHVALLVTSVEHRRRFCVAAHTRGAKAGRLSPATIAAPRASSLPDDSGDAALATFVRAVIRERGLVLDQAIEAFLAAGFKQQQAHEVILGATLKILTNYVNHLTHELVEFAWEGDARNSP